MWMSQNVFRAAQYPTVLIFTSLPGSKRIWLIYREVKYLKKIHHTHIWTESIPPAGHPLNGHGMFGGKQSMISYHMKAAKAPKYSVLPTAVLSLALRFFSESVSDIYSIVFPHNITGVITTKPLANALKKPDFKLNIRNEEDANGSWCIRRTLSGKHGLFVWFCRRGCSLYISSLEIGYIACVRRVPITRWILVWHISVTYPHSTKVCWICCETPPTLAASAQIPVERPSSCFTPCWLAGLLECESEIQNCSS